MLTPKEPFKGNSVLQWAKSAVKFMRENQVRSSADVQVSRTYGGTTLAVNFPPVPWSLFALGPTVAADEVTLTAGKLYHGARAGLDLPTGPFTISGLQTIVAIYSWANNTVGIQVVATTTDFPDDTGLAATPLHDWDIGASGVASLKKIRHLGDIRIRGAFA